MSYEDFNGPEDDFVHPQKAKKKGKKKGKKGEKKKREFESGNRAIERDVVEPTPAPVSTPVLLGGENIHRTSRSHILTVIALTIVAISLVAPPVLSFYFGLELNSANATKLGPTISAGDLLISKHTPASVVKVNDVVILRDLISGKAHEGRVVLKSEEGTSTSITVENGRTQVQEGPYIFKAGANVPVVQRVVPNFGYPLEVFASPRFKAVSGLFLIGLTLVIVEMRRIRKHNYRKLLRFYSAQSSARGVTPEDLLRSKF